MGMGPRPVGGSIGNAPGAAYPGRPADATGGRPRCASSSCPRSCRHRSSRLSRCTPNGTVPAANRARTSGALYGWGWRANICRKQTSTKWSHQLSLAGRSASTRASNVAYVCGPYLTRSDTVSTRRRAHRRKAGNSAGLVGTDSDI